MSKLSKVVKDKFDEVYLKIAEEINKNLGLVLGKKVSVDFNSRKWQTLSEAWTSIVPMPVAASIILIESEYKGRCVLLFTKKDAILLSGLLSMYGETALKEKMASLEFGEPEMDAFNEICNQIIGFIDRGMVESFPKKIHLKKGSRDEDTLIIQKEDDIKEPFAQLFSQDDVVHFPLQVSIESSYQPVINLVCPISLMTRYIGVDIKEEKEEPEKTDTEQEEVVTLQNFQDDSKTLCINLASDHDVELEQFFAETNINHEYVNSFSQMREQIQQRHIRLIVIQTNGNLKKGIEFCHKLSQALRQINIPIWIYGSSWDQQLIKQAVQAGAVYLLVKPLNQKLIQQKIEKLIN